MHIYLHEIKFDLHQWNVVLTTYTFLLIESENPSVFDLSPRGYLLLQQAPFQSNEKELWTVRKVSYKLDHLLVQIVN